MKKFLSNLHQSKPSDFLAEVIPRLIEGFTAIRIPPEFLPVLFVFNFLGLFNSIISKPGRFKDSIPHISERIAMSHFLMLFKKSVLFNILPNAEPLPKPCIFQQLMVINWDFR